MTITVDWLMRTGYGVNILSPNKEQRVNRQRFRIELKVDRVGSAQHHTTTASFARGFVHKLLCGRYYFMLVLMFYLIYVT